MSCSSFTDVLYTKYGEEIAEEVGGPGFEIFLVGSYPGRASPSGRLILPRILTLNDCNIDRAGSTQVIKDLCKDVEELDLAQNEFGDTSEIEKIISHMPKLWFLNLSHNDMSEAKPLEMEADLCITSLVLNHTYAPWHVVNSFLRCIPKLEELHLSLNDYASVGFDTDRDYPSVKQLHISGNPINSWDHLKHIATCFPNLEKLIMADSSLESIPESFHWSDHFRKLHSINLNNGQFREWEDIDRLNNFPQLDSFRLQGLPVLEEFTEKERRQHLIARLSCAKRLNGSPIQEKEREDAERAFIRFYLDINDKPKRYHELVAKHGKLNPLVNVNLAPKKKAKVNIVYQEQRETIEIHVEKTVKDLKFEIGQLLSMSPSKLRLFYIDKEMSHAFGPEELKFNSKKLYSIQVQDGDEFLVDQK